jgi:1-acyl-sn-glycerol-3-phosphate acyltransferase
MDRQPLLDQFPYRFYPPSFGRAWWLLSRSYNTFQILRREHQVVEIEVRGSEHLWPLLDTGDGVLITPNHSDGADAGTFFEVSHRIGRGFGYLAGYQLFHGMARHLLPRIGAFPIDREGTDLRAFKAGVEILTGGRHPLVIFPEGEIYYTNDRITPLREGAVAFASTAAKRLRERGKTVWIVPTAVKYRFLESVDPLPALSDLMSQLETRFTWWPRSNTPIVERIYGYAEGLLGLKELEVHGAARSGSLKERLANLRDSILDRVEDRRIGKRSNAEVPVRIKEARRACLEALTAGNPSPEEAESLRHDLHEIFVALQLFSYPGDYVSERPTLERVAETLFKFEQDALGSAAASPKGQRRAIVSFGEPIDLSKCLETSERLRVVNARITEELEGRIQALLDEIGPGRDLPKG